MPFTYDDKAVTAYLNTLVALVDRGVTRGLATIAPTLEHAMQTDPAHGDQSGAAHASYVVAALGGTQDTQGELDFATAVAADRLSSFTGHEGHAARITAPTVGEFQRGLVLGSPVDYAQSLAAEGRSPVEPILRQYAGAIAQAARDGIKAELK